MLGTDRWYGTMPKVCLCWIVWVIETTELEEVIAAVDMETKQKKQKERKRERKRKKEQKGKERNAELRRRKKDREFAYYAEEFEYYILLRGTRSLRRTIRRRAMHYIPPELWLDWATT
jgi:hypothetical protein